jgi:hypothetical protein
MNFLLLIEVITYIFFIYAIILFSIFVKPNIYIASLIFVCCFIASWLIIAGCKSKLISNVGLRVIVLLFYAAACLGVYYLIHNTWDIYQNNIYYKGFLLISPIVFYSSIKYGESLLQCNNNHIITTPIRYFKLTLPLVRSFLHI